VQRGGSCLLGLQHNHVKCLHLQIPPSTSDRLRHVCQIKRSVFGTANYARVFASQMNLANFLIVLIS